ncbi:MAG TPA: dTDP-4-dehydrorhamnose 3,5-epimerase [Magnetospirillaceae bacterium]|nr:dTDP-4-dehydrorhamnose 3,5-epimerase [Magnetospirillaceae bacterium]
MFSVQPTAIPDVKVVSTTWHGDERGAFSETYQRDRFVQAGIDVSFIQDNHVGSRRAGTLRGLHFQVPPAAQSKLIRVVRGAIFDVAVDIRPNSATYGKWAGMILSAENRLQYFIPAGFAHGYLTLEDDSEVIYKVDAPYAPSQERGLLWNDPAIGIEWPSLPVQPVLASRDAALPLLADLPPIEDWGR